MVKHYTFNVEEAHHFYKKMQTNSCSTGEELLALRIPVLVIPHFPTPAVRHNEVTAHWFKFMLQQNINANPFSCKLHPVLLREKKCHCAPAIIIKD